MADRFTRLLYMRPQVDGPDSVSKATIEAGANPGTWNVSYIPTEVGVFDVRVVSAGQQLPGSPWHPKIIDTRNLRVIGEFYRYF